MAYQYYYDLASNETQRYNYLNSVAQVYTPDNLNRMARRDVMHSSTTLASEGYDYDEMNRLQSVNHDDGTSDSFGYYKDGELNTAQYNATPTPTPTPTPTATPTPTPHAGAPAQP